MTDSFRTNPDRDPQSSGGEVEPGDGHALAEKARARAADDPHDDTTTDGDGDDAGGEVSSVQNMDAERAEMPISDSQSVAGQPDQDGGPVDEGPTGPNSRGGADRN